MAATFPEAVKTIDNIDEVIHESHQPVYISGKKALHSLIGNTHLDQTFLYNCSDFFIVIKIAQPEIPPSAGDTHPVIYKYIVQI